MNEPDHEKTYFFASVKNKGADISCATAQADICTFVFRCLDSIRCVVSISAEEIRCVFDDI